MLLQRMLKDDGVPPDRIEEFRKYLGQVTSETARVGRIVSDLLAFSRRSKPQRAPADLNRIVRRTLSLVQHKMKLSNVEVETASARGPARRRLRRLADPAGRAEPAAERRRGHPVQSRSARVAVATVDGRRHRRCCTVSDNGEGIPPENLAKIFDPFFTTKPEGKGVGLGLAVSYGIIQAHGGDIEVKSQRGEGTTFTVSLPLEPRGAGQANEVLLYVGATPEVEREALTADDRHASPAEFELPVRRMELPSIDFAFDAAPQPVRLHRRPRDAPPRSAPEDAYKLLAVTERDLFIPVLTFVFGQAQLGGRVGVVSLARLRQEFYGLPPDRDVLLDARVKEALHETGHLFGLVHCADRDCAMSLSTGIRQIDLKTGRILRRLCGRVSNDGSRESQTI